MESLFSEIQNLEASDIASILRQVQTGSLTVEEAPGGSTTTQSRDDDAAYYTPETGHGVPEVLSIAEAVADVDPTPDVSLSMLSARHISLRRPGRSVPLQSDVEIPVPLSKTELQKQIFQARMMGVPSDVTERISQKTGLGSPTKVIKPNIGMSRSVSHRAQLEEEIGKINCRIICFNCFKCFTNSVWMQGN